MPKTHVADCSLEQIFRMPEIPTPPEDIFSSSVTAPPVMPVQTEYPHQTPATPTSDSQMRCFAGRLPTRATATSPPWPGRAILEAEGAGQGRCGQTESLPPDVMPRSDSQTAENNSNPNTQHSGMVETEASSDVQVISAQVSNCSTQPLDLGEDTTMAEISHKIERNSIGCRSPEKLCKILHLHGALRQENDSTSKSEASAAQDSEADAYTLLSRKSVVDSVEIRLSFFSAGNHSTSGQCRWPGVSYSSNGRIACLVLSSFGFAALTTSTGVKMPSLNSIDKADTTQRPQAVRQNVAKESEPNLKRLEGVVQNFDTVPAEILEWLRSQHGWEVGEMDFLMLITTYGQTGDFNRTERILKYMNKKGYTPSVISHIALMKAYGRAGQCSKVEGICHRMKSSEPESSPLTYQIILKTFVEANKFEEAEAVFQNLLNEDRASFKPDQKMFHMMIYMYRKASIYNQARNIFSQMAEKGIPQSAVTFNSLMSFETSYKEVSSIFDLMQRSGIRPDVGSYTFLISAYGKARREDEALAVFEEMLNANVIVYGTLMEDYVKTNNIERVMRVYERMRMQGVESNQAIYTIIMDSYAKTLEEHEEANELVINVINVGSNLCEIMRCKSNEANDSNGAEKIGNLSSFDENEHKVHHLDWGKPLHVVILKSAFKIFDPGICLRPYLPSNNVPRRSRAF